MKTSFLLAFHEHHLITCAWIPVQPYKYPLWQLSNPFLKTFTIFVLNIMAVRAHLVIIFMLLAGFELSQAIRCEEFPEVRRFKDEKGVYIVKAGTRIPCDDFPPPPPPPPPPNGCPCHCTSYSNAVSHCAGLNHCWVMTKNCNAGYHMCCC